MVLRADAGRQHGLIGSEVPPGSRGGAGSYVMSITVWANDGQAVRF